MQHLKFTYIPEVIEGEIDLPSSKSISNRVLIIRALSGDFNIENLSEADDTQIMLSALSSKDADVFIGNAGTTMRFLTAYFAIGNQKKILRGDAQMNQRPIAPLVNALKSIGAKIEYVANDGFTPVKIYPSKLDGNSVEIDSEISSQFISALMLIAPMLEKGLEIKFNSTPTSLPYIKMTAEIMRYFSADVSIYKKEILIKPQIYSRKNFEVESDWSSASYLYALAALKPGSKLKMNKLKESSVQGDWIISKLMLSFGVNTEFLDGNSIISSNGKYPLFFDADMIDHPDLIPTMVCLCIALDIPFKISGTRTLKFKETDRELAIKTELEKIGINIDMDENSLVYNGEFLNRDIEVLLNTYNDHRLVMSFSLLALKYPNIKIENPFVVKKSYPSYFSELKKAGFKFEIR